MRILIISYYYYPEVNPRSIRWNAIANYLSNKDHEITVLSCSQDSKISEYLENNIRIIRVPENSLGRLRRKFGKAKDFKSSPKESFSFLDKFILFPLISISKIFVKSIYRVTLMSFQWPDHAWSWIGPAKKQIKKFINNEKDFDVVISVSHPFSSHVIARSLKKRSKGILWIMDNGDPFSFMTEVQVNNFFLYQRLNKQIESKYIKESNAVAVTTEETKLKYIKNFQHAQEKINVINPLLNPEAISFKEKKSNDKESMEYKNPNSIRIVFVGTLYKRIRNPKNLLKLLDIASEKINKAIKVDFYGPINDLDISSFFFSGISVEFHGQIERELAFQKMSEADILLNIGNMTTYQLPSKLIEYAGMLKPILNISSVKKDSSTQFLSQYPAAKSICVMDEISDDMIEEIVDYLNNASSFDLNYNDDWLEAYKIQTIGKRYELLFSKPI